MLASLHNLTSIFIQRQATGEVITKTALFNRVGGGDKLVELELGGAGALKTTALSN